MARGKHSPGVEYHRQLVEDTLNGYSEAYEWLRSRGISNFTIAKWDLGFVRKPARGHSQYRGRISIPYKDSRGREVAVRFRRIDGGKPKYDGVTGGDAHVFAVRFTREDIVYVTEGEFDCMILHQLGYKAVGIPGANVWKDEWKWLFRGCERIVIVPDGDGKIETVKKGNRDIQIATKGMQFRMLLNGSFRAVAATVNTVVMPKGYDVNSLYLDDRKRLRSLLEVK